MKPSHVIRCACALLAALGLGTTAGHAQTRKPLRGHLPGTEATRLATGRLEATRSLNLAIGLPVRDPAALDAFLRDLYHPGSTNFHRYLKPEQFAERFGPTEQDYQAVADFARSRGLIVTGIHPGRMLLEVTGTAADVEKVFQIHLLTYAHPTEGRSFYAPDVEPSVPAEMPILDVGGLDDFSKPGPLISRIVPLESGAKVTTAEWNGDGPNGTYVPEDFKAAYTSDVSLGGEGQSIGLLEFDNCYASDVRAYAILENLPVPRLTTVLLPGATGTPGANNTEVALDVEMAIGIAPNLSSVILYEAPLNNAVEFSRLLIRMAEDDAAAQLSSSWNPPSGPSATRDQIFAQMAAQGQSFFQASGDNGAYTNGVVQQADNPYETIVGGTSLQIQTYGYSSPYEEYYYPVYGGESVWNLDQTHFASGGGISTNYPIPFWQMGVDMSDNGGSTTHRNSPDVAMAADGILLIADRGKKSAVASTSAAAPMWAGFVALANQQAALDGLPSIGFLNPAIYEIGEGANYGPCFHDVTSGDNTSTASPNQFYASAGYDLCTGWGSPGGQALLDALTVGRATLNIVPTNGFVATGLVGGPFDTNGKSFSLANTGWMPVNWSFGELPAWLDVSTNHGLLLPNQPAVTVNVSLNATAAELGPGTYQATIVFVNLVDGSKQTLAFTLRILDLGAVQVSISPVGAVQAGAQWRVDGGPWQDSGAIVTGLFSSNHIVDFAGVPNWTTPLSQTTTILGHNTNVLNAVYGEQFGALTVNLFPTDATAVGAHWRVDGGTWMSSGDVASGLTATNHNLEFSSVSGWLTPAPQTVAVAGNKNTALTGLYTESYQFMTPAGVAGIIGSADGTNSSARFASPRGIAVDGSGHVFVVDTGNNAIRELTPQGTNWVVSTISGQAGQKGTNDGVGNSARFNGPLGVAVDAMDNLYVTDTGNNTIRMLRQQGTNWVASTIAGSPGVTGNQDGAGSTALFSSPTGIAVDPSGNLYETDLGYFVTWGFITGIGYFRSLENSASGWTVGTFRENAIWNNAYQGYNPIQYGWPSGVTVVPGAGPYLAGYGVDDGNPSIFGLVGEPYTGFYGFGYPAYDPASVATFPFWGISGVGLASDALGNIYAAVADAQVVCKLIPYGRAPSGFPNYTFTTIGGIPSLSGSADGTNSSALFNTPGNVAVDSNGVLYLTDTGNNTIRMGRSLLNPVQILAAPSNASVQAGSFQVDGGTWTAIGTVVRLAAGDHSILFQTIPGWITPPSQTFTVNSNQTFTGQYAEEVGSLNLTLGPAQAVADGARWQLDGGTWTASGATLSGVQTGSHLLAFTNIHGWITPASESVVVAPGSNTLSVFYAPSTTNKPSLSITSPTPGLRWTNQTFTMAGVATDLVAVAGVWYQINGGGWMQATGTNRWQSTPTVLGPGETTIQAYAMDTSGNLSKTNSLRFLNAPVAPLTVTISGHGSISPNLNGQYLTVGRQYSITAKPATGSLFSNWTGDYSATTTLLSFEVQTNTHLLVNFVPSPFSALAGTYEGLFYNTNTVTQPSAGFFSARLSGSGACSATLQTEEGSYNFAPQFSLLGQASNDISRAIDPISLQLSLDLPNGTGMTGELLTATWKAQLLAYRPPFSSSNPSPQKGRYTLGLPGSRSSASLPGGDGYGTATVDALGNITFAGTLPDGKVVSQSAVISAQGLWPFYSSLYSGQGVILGWLDFGNSATTGPSGNLTWIARPQPGVAFYSDGFVAQQPVEGSPYTFTNGHSVAGFGPGQLSLTGGNLQTPFTNLIGWGTNNIIKNLTSNNLTLSIATASGVFHGTVVSPATHKSIPFSGAILQNQNAGFGLFAGTNQTGDVLLQPLK